MGSYLLSPANILGLGASGAIMGVIGAYVVIGLRRRLPVAPVVALLVLNLLIGFTGGIDWRAHLGGLAVGRLLAFVYDYAGGLRDRPRGLALTVGVRAWATLAAAGRCSSPGLRQGTSTGAERHAPLRRMVARR